MVAPKIQEFLATGRRKTSVASVRLSSGTGKVVINGRPLETYFGIEMLRASVVFPFKITDRVGKYDVRANVKGGGPTGQAGAMSLGISRALLEVDVTLRPILKAQGLLTRDSRMRERKKYGQPGARKRFQFSKR
ncbi:30S ribosomal protein S9 [Verrucomicrobiota bacterium]|nr:30S ribosomal protein S9 [Verrucomicrobiota bacterium]